MKHSAENVPARLKLPAALESLERFQDFVRGRLRDGGRLPETLFKIQLALEEALVNIIHYAYPPGSSGWIELACFLEKEPARLRVEIRDGGRPFNPFECGKPELTASLEQRQIGGLGIFLIRQMTEQANYRRDSDFNVLTLEFRLKSP